MANKDVNLPDESAGKPVGRLPYGARSKDPLKQSYMDRIKRKNKKAGILENQQEKQSREIFGGDADDPRWEEHNERVKMFASKKSTMGLGRKK